MRIFLILLVFTIAAEGQNRARTNRRDTVNAGAYNLPAVTFHCALKEITSKEIVLDRDDGQTVTIYRNRKTRFLRDGQTVNPKQIAAGSKLTLDVAENPDGTLLAINVMASK